MDGIGSNHNLTHQLAHNIGSAIVQGKYSQENHLPSEAEICEQFNVSRSATREAVKMLTAKGMLTSRPRQGIRIQPQSNWNMFDTDVLKWILAGTTSLKMLSEFLQLRLAIEPEAAALAAANGDEAAIRLIADALSRMKNAEAGLDDTLEADIAFHTSLLLASGNPFFIQLRNFIETALRVSIRFTNHIKGVSAASYDDHRAIYDAIAQKRPKLAHATSRKIQTEALTLIQQQLVAETKSNTKVVGAC